MQIRKNIESSESLFYFCGENIFYQEIKRLLRLRRGELLKALWCGDKQAVEKSAVALMGLGVGLTPTGDDYLAGLCAILFIRGSPWLKYRHVFISALENGKQQTTLLSTITLREAISQRYRERIYRFIFKITHDDIRDIQQSINDIKQIGSSSGSDMLIGMADALALTAHFGGEYVYQDCD